MVTHGGHINGFGAEQLWLPDDSLRVVVFINSFNTGPAKLAEDIARAVLNLPTRSVTGLVSQSSAPPSWARTHYRCRQETRSR